MFQEPLLLRGTVAHNAGLGLALRGVGQEERELELNQLKIEHLADRSERTPAPDELVISDFRRRRYSAGDPAQFIPAKPKNWRHNFAASVMFVEELVAIVDPRTRKVEIVFPRWGSSKLHDSQSRRRTETIAATRVFDWPRSGPLGAPTCIYVASLR